MKKFILSVYSLLIALSINAQTFTADQLEKYAKDKYGSNWIKAAENLKGEVALDNKNRLNYQEVIECPGQTKDQLFDKAIEKLKKAFNSQDTHGNILEEDKENGLIIAQAYIEKIGTQSAGMNHYQVDVAPYIRIDLKEERARVSTYADKYEVTITKGGGLTSMIAGVATVAAVAVVAASTDSDKDSDKSDSQKKESSSSTTNQKEEDKGIDERWDISSCYPFVERDKHKKASSKAFVMTSAFQNSIIDIMKEALLADSSDGFDDNW